MNDDTNRSDMTDEWDDVLATVRSLARDKLYERAFEIDAKSEFPFDVVELYAEVGLLGATAPAEYGGSGFNLSQHCQILEELAKVDGTCAIIYQSQQVTGIQPIVYAGSEAQKAKYLPLIMGGGVSSLAITEPDAGSDVSGIKTRAVQSNGDYVLNGSKRYATHADVADFVIVLARTGTGPRSMTTFIVDKGTPGLTVGPPMRKMGLHGSTTVDLYLDDVRVPADQVLGEVDSAYEMALHCLQWGRPAVGSLAVGLAQGALDYATDFGLQRTQFGRPVVDFQGVRFMIADMAMGIEAARLLVRDAAAAVDRQSPDLVARSAMAKCFATDMAMSVTTDAVQLCGGAGYISELPVERMMRDAKVLQIFEGTNQIQRNLIAKAVLGGRSSR